MWYLLIHFKAEEKFILEGKWSFGIQWTYRLKYLRENFLLSCNNLRVIETEFDRDILVVINV